MNQYNYFKGSEVPLYGSSKKEKEKSITDAGSFFILCSVFESEELRFMLPKKVLNEVEKNCQRYLVTFRVPCLAYFL